MRSDVELDPMDQQGQSLRISHSSGALRVKECRQSSQQRAKIRNSNSQEKVRLEFQLGVGGWVELCTVSVANCHSNTRLGGAVMLFLNMKRICQADSVIQHLNNSWYLVYSGSQVL